jgi:hypothetical protein
MITSRISTDCTVTPHGLQRASISSWSRPSIAEGRAADDVAQGRLGRPTHRVLILLHLQRRLLRVVHHPEEDGVDIHRHGVRGQGLFRGEAGRDHALIDP